MAHGRNLIHLSGASRKELVPPPARGSYVLEFFQVTNRAAASITVTVLIRSGGQDYILEDAVLLETKDKLAWTGRQAILPTDRVEVYLAAKPTTEPHAFASWEVDQ